MLNIISAEWTKMRKNKIFLVCSLIVLLSAGFIVIRDLIITSNPPENYHTWIMVCSMVTGLVMSVMSGFIVTFLMQREYEDKTIINVLTAPTSRLVYLLSKLTTWFLWYIVILFATEFIYITGAILIFPDTFNFESVKTLVLVLTKCRLLGFVSSIPLLWVAVLQKRLFYPSVMVALAFAGVEVAAILMSVEMASIIPWSAGPVLSFLDAPSPYNVIALASIALTGIAGFLLAYVSFKKQDQ